MIRHTSNAGRAAVVRTGTPTSRLAAAIVLTVGALAASVGLVSSPTAATPETSTADDRLGYDFVVSDDGTYIWYNDERAVVKDRTLLAGFVQADGDAGITTVDLATGRRLSQNILLADWSHGDDHNNPSIVSMNDGRIGVFYSGHDWRRFEYARFSNVGIPTSVDDFGPEQSYATPMDGEPFDGRAALATYANAYQLSGEGNKIYNFFRLDKNYLHFHVHDSNGELLTPDGPVRLIIDPVYVNLANWQGRVYAKFASNGVDRIDMVLTDGHPSSLQPITLYHAYLQNGNLYQTDGSLIGNVIEDGPFALKQLTKVVVGSDTWQPWNHEIKLDGDGNPVIVYSEQEDRYKLQYGYARWDAVSKAWLTTTVAKAGRSLIPLAPIDPATGEPVPDVGSQPYYAGGIALNPLDVNEVFISAKINPITKQETPKFEIYRGVLADGAFTWTAITQDSAESNFRPFVPTGAQYGDQVVIWFTGKYDHFVNGIVGKGAAAHYYEGYNTRIVGRYLHRGFAQGDDHYAIDLNGKHAVTPDGYTPLEGAKRSALVTERATVRLVNANGGRERPDVDDDLLSDFAFAWRDLDVSIENLSPGYYTVSLTNYDLENDQDVSVQFFPTGSDPVTVVDSHSQTDPTPTSFVVKVDADTDYTLRLKRLGTRASVLNSLSITPSTVPLASFEPSSEVEAAVGSSLSFDGSASVDPDGGELTYEWRSTGMPGIVSRSATFERRFDTPGRVGVELTVIDDEGERATQHVNVFVATTLPSLPPVASFLPAADIEVAVGTTQTFDGGASVDPDGGELTYEWRSTGMPGIVSRLATFERRFDTPGRFGVELTVIDDEGQRARQHINVRVVAAQQAAGPASASTPPPASAPPPASSSTPAASTTSP